VLEAERIERAAETFVYGYPLVYNMDELAKLPAGEATAFGRQVLPYNQFGKARELLDPTVEFVSPNNDTLYLLAVGDLGQGPLVLHAPDTNDRYYVLQFVDAWTNNFAYVGRRATGTKEGEFLLAPSGYHGVVPDQMRVIEAPSRSFAIVGRIQVNGKEDLPAVHALQDQFKITPLSVHQGGASPAAPTGIPAPDAAVGKDLAFWEKFRVGLAAFPPPAADKDFVEAAAEFGATDVDSPYVRPDPGLSDLLVEAEKIGRALIEDLGKKVIKIEDGWASALHAFDYNLDRCGPGTLDTPQWKIADRTKAYVTRAIAARIGLWGNHGYEADYEVLWQDEHGDFLDGSHAYELRLSPPPPAQAFWSLTMYDEPDYHLVANPIDRYSIGDRTPGLRLNSDRSVTIHMQSDSPGPDKEANWLPSPPGRFRPILRAYQPDQAILDGTYKLPKVRRTR
jgi:hypothetical protein